MSIVMISMQLPGELRFAEVRSRVLERAESDRQARDGRPSWASCEDVEDIPGESRSAQEAFALCAASSEPSGVATARLSVGEREWKSSFSKHLYDTDRRAVYRREDVTGVNHPPLKGRASRPLSRPFFFDASSLAFRPRVSPSATRSFDRVDLLRAPRPLSWRGGLRASTTPFRGVG